MALSVLIASDHAGFTLKANLISTFTALPVDWLDLGAHSEERSDYPDFARALAAALEQGRATYGVLICGTGIGISIAANRFKHVRAALCTDVTAARASRAHNDANVICFGARMTGTLVAQEALYAFLTTDFEGGRHADRVSKLTTCG